MDETSRDKKVETYNLENSKSQLRKGFLEFSVLLIIGTQPTYAVDILKQLKEANLLVVEGTVYPLLSRLKTQGIVSYEWEESKNGPPRKMYSITEDGKAFLEVLEAYWKSLDSIITIFITQYEKSN